MCNSAEMRVTGILSGSRIIPECIQPVELRAETLLEELQGFMKEPAV
jgi:hypothetical protein